MNRLKFSIAFALASAAALTTAGAAPPKKAATPVTVSNHATLFGITLGSPLAVPDCPTRDQFGSAIVDEDSIKQFCVEPLSASAASAVAQARHVHFPAGAKPIYLRYRFISVTIRSGVVQEIEFFTTGVTSQELVLAELKLKFGPPKQTKASKMSNLMGASFQGISAAWKVGSDEVLFEGVLGRFDTGYFNAKTIEEKAIEAASEAARHERAPAL